MRQVVYLLSVLLLGCTAHPSRIPRLQLANGGGDLWSFATTVLGSIDGECDEVLVRSPLQSRRATVIGSHFRARVALGEGVNELVADCMQDGRAIAASAEQRWNVRAADIPKAWVRISIEEHTVHLDAGRSELASGRVADLRIYEWYAERGNPTPLLAVGGGVVDPDTALSGKSLVLRRPKLDGDYQVRLRVVDALGRTDTARGVFRVVAGKAQLVDLQTEHPAWVDRAILYGAAPFVYDPQTFAGVAERLDELASLGATAVWLSPVQAAPYDDFGYSVLDHFGLNARFGDRQSFERFVRRAHQLGLKVILDVVPNHVSRFHPYYLDAVAKGERSAYHDWFARDASGEVIQYFDWSHLKPLNYDQPQVQAYVIAALTAWVREYDVDGFRIDASWAVARRAPEFWPRLRQEVKRIKPSFLMIAEASAREAYHFANGFDAAYDWTGRLGEWAWGEVFQDGRVHLAKLRAALTNGGAGFPPDTLMLRFINNNDTGERFAVRHGLDMARLAATLLFTLPGIPLIYNGDEMAADFEPYDEGPPLQWNDAHPLVTHYRRLAKVREHYAALRSRELRLLATDHADAVLVFERPAKQNAGLLALFNFSDQPLAIRPADQTARARFAQYASSVDVLTGGACCTRSGVIHVPARSARVLIQLDAAE